MGNERLEAARLASTWASGDRNVWDGLVGREPGVFPQSSSGAGWLVVQGNVVHFYQVRHKESGARYALKRMEKVDDNDKAEH